MSLIDYIRRCINYHCSPGSYPLGARGSLFVIYHHLIITTKHDRDYTYCDSVDALQLTPALQLPRTIQKRNTIPTFLSREQFRKPGAITPNCTDRTVYGRFKVTASLDKCKSQRRSQNSEPEENRDEEEEEEKRTRCSSA